MLKQGLDFNEACMPPTQTTQAPGVRTCHDIGGRHVLRQTHIQPIEPGISVSCKYAEIYEFGVYMPAYFKDTDDKNTKKP
jgi:hypothetical protein